MKDFFKFNLLIGYSCSVLKEPLHQNRSAFYRMVKGILKLAPFLYFKFLSPSGVVAIPDRLDTGNSRIP
jgi:hypothetical protein